jgi:hypothetical protein
MHERNNHPGAAVCLNTSRRLPSDDRLAKRMILGILDEYQTNDALGFSCQNLAASTLASTWK